MGELLDVFVDDFYDDIESVMAIKMWMFCESMYSYAIKDNSDEI